MHPKSAALTLPIRGVAPSSTRRQESSVRLPTTPETLLVRTTLRGRCLQRGRARCCGRWYALSMASQMNEVIFLVEQAPEGGYVARALGLSIFVEAETLDAVHSQVRDAVRCHFEEGQAPKVIRLHFARDEVISA